MQKRKAMKREGYVYIMTNKNRTVLYVGITNNLIRRVREHKNHFIKGSFTDRYNCEYCIYYEKYSDIMAAIQRETAMKKLSRKNKERLINKLNPEWKELVKIPSAAVSTLRQAQRPQPPPRNDAQSMNQRECGGSLSDVNARIGCRRHCSMRATVIPSTHSVRRKLFKLSEIEKFIFLQLVWVWACAKIY